MTWRGVVMCLVAAGSSWGCAGGDVDRTEPSRVGVAAVPVTSGRASMEDRGDGIQHVEEGRIPQRRLLDGRRLLEGREFPERPVCMKRRCVDAWEDRGRGLIALRVRSGAEAEPAPDHVTLLWGGAGASSRALTALRDAVRDAPAARRFSLVQASDPPRVLARSGTDASSREALVDAFEVAGSTRRDIHAGLESALEESERGGASRRRVVVVVGEAAWARATTPGRSEEMLRAERGVEVGVFSEGARADAGASREMARVGMGPRGHVTGGGDAWARAALGEGLVHAGAVTLDVTLPEGVRVERAWGGVARMREGGVEVEFGGLVGYTGEELFDAVVLFRVSRGEGSVEDVSVSFEGEVFEPEGAELGDLGDAASTLEALEAALGAFEAGGASRAVEITRERARAVAERGRDARLLGALEDALEDFIGR